MSGAITHNFEDAANKLRALQARIQSVGTRAMHKGMDIFLGQCIRKYYAGRPGLNAPTGTLWRGWHISSWMGGDDSIVKLANSQKYARIHEYGGTIKAKNGGWLVFPISNVSYRVKPTKRGTHSRVVSTQWVKVRSVTIPKRTDVLGEYGRTGYNIIKSQVETALQNILKA